MPRCIKCSCQNLVLMWGAEAEVRPKIDSEKGTRELGGGGGACPRLWEGDILKFCALTILAKLSALRHPLATDLVNC